MNYEINIQIPNEDPKITFVATGPAGPAGAAGQDSIVGTVTDGVITAAKLHADLSGIATLILPDNTTITTFTAGLLDDSDAAAARTTLGLGTGATLNTAAIANGGTGLATADQIHTFVTTQTDSIASSTSGTAAVATTVTVTDNEGTGEANLITFVANAATATGSHGLEMDGDLTYNPGDGELTSPKFKATTITLGSTIEHDGNTNNLSLIHI